MNRSQVYRNILLAVSLMLGLVGVASAQKADAEMQELSATEMRSIKAAAAKPTAATFWAVTQEFEGNFDSVDAYMAKFEREAKAQNIPNANPVGVLILWEDPEGKSQFKMSVGITLTRRVTVKEPLTVNQWTFSDAVRYTSVGPYNRLGVVGRNLKVAMKESPMRRKKDAARPMANEPFAVLRLVSDPKKVKPEQLRTELIVPVKEQ